MEDALGESELKFHTLWDAIPTPVVIARASDGLILYANKHLSLMFGLAIESMIGSKAVGFYYNPAERQPVLNLLKENGYLRNYELQAKKVDGTPFWISISVEPLNFKGESAVFAAFYDITERKQAELELQKAHRALKTLSECNQIMIHAQEEADLLDSICQVIINVGGYRLAWVGFAEQNAAKQVRPVAQAGYEEGYLELLNITWADTPQGRGPTGKAIRTGEPSIAKNMLSDPDFAPWRDQALKRGYASSIALPLNIEGQAFGAINIYAQESDAFDAEEVSLLTKLADNLAYGIISLRSRREYERAELALRESEERYRRIIDTASEGI